MRRGVTKVFDIGASREGVQRYGTSLLDGVASLTLVIGAKPAPKFETVSIFATA